MRFKVLIPIKKYHLKDRESLFADGKQTTCGLIKPWPVVYDGLFDVWEAPSGYTLIFGEYTNNKYIFKNLDTAVNYGLKFFSYPERVKI